jgi:hypothetical protein
VDKTTAQRLSNCIIVQHANEAEYKMTLNEFNLVMVILITLLGSNDFRRQREMNILFDKTQLRDFSALSFKEIGSLFD